MNWNHLLERIEKISWAHWRILSLLFLGALIQGMALISLDVGLLPPFIENHGLWHLGFDFLCLSVFFSFMGRITVKLDRRNGYGGVPLTAGIFGILWAYYFMLRHFGHTSFMIQFGLIYRYVAPLLLTACFWNIARRFITLRFTSFKFLGILGAELLGYVIGGLNVICDNEYSSFAYLKQSLWGLAVVLVILKILVCLLPVPSETFVRKSGGVQDTSENKMLISILWIAFLLTGCQFLSDAFFYHSLPSVHSPQIIAALGLGKGFLGLCLLVLFCYLPYSSTLISGLGGILLSLLFVCAGQLWTQPVLIWMGIMILGSLIYLYAPYFLSMLPRVLILGQGQRLRWRRQVIIQPLAIVFAGGVIITLSPFVQGGILLLMTLALGGFIWFSLSFYNQFLLQMCQMRRWCGGPLILFSKKVIHYILENVKNQNEDDVIYFLRIMQQSDYVGYTSQLIQALHHPKKNIRLFALDKLDLVGIDPKLLHILQQQFNKEKDIDVKARLLAILIHSHKNHHSQNVFHKYGHYLDDRHLKSGAILGFLQAGGDCALLAMDGLQQMVQSVNTQQNLKALEIINHIPTTGLVRLVLPLLKSKTDAVMQQALLTAGRIGHVQALSFVLSALDYPPYQESALKSLQLYGKQAFPPIEKMIANPFVPLSRRKKLILFLQTLPSGEGKQILLRLIHLPEQKLRKDILNAILESKIVWLAHKRRKILKLSIQEDIGRWQWLLRNKQKCHQAPNAQLADTFSSLFHSFDEALQDTRLIIFYQLMLLYPNTLIERAIRILLSSNTGHYEMAISLLQDLMPAQMYQNLLPIFQNQTIKEPISLTQNQAVDFLKKLLISPEFPVDRWVQSCVLSGLRSFGNKGFIPLLKYAFHTPWMNVWEVALSNLAEWLPSVKEQEKFLDTIRMENPNLAFNHYLKQQEEL